MATPTENLRTRFNEPARTEESGPQRSSRLSSVLIVDDEPGILGFLQKGLSAHFSLVEVAADADAADALLDRCHFDLIISDIRLPGRSGVEWVAQLREQGRMTPVIFMTAHAELQTAITALRAGASDFLLKPFRMEQMEAAVGRCMESQRLQRENFLLRRQVGRIEEGSGILGSCDLIQGICEVIKRVAQGLSDEAIAREPRNGMTFAAEAPVSGLPEPQVRI